MLAVLFLAVQNEKISQIPPDIPAKFEVLFLQSFAGRAGWCNPRLGSPEVFLVAGPIQGGHRGTKNGSRVLNP